MPQATDPGVAVLLIHGFPSGLVGADHIGADLPQLADRFCDEMSWTAMAIRLRGCGQSDGNFSLRGWVEDASAGIEYLIARPGCNQVWVCGFGTGGAVGLVAASERLVADGDDSLVGGGAIIGTPADFDDWADEPDRLLAHARQARAVTDVDFPADMNAWQEELRGVRAASAAEQFGSRQLLVLHGLEDESVPQMDARIVADAHGSADLRLIKGAGHQLRHDPRGMAILLAWLERARRA